VGLLTIGGKKSIIDGRRLGLTLWTIFRVRGPEVDTKIHEIPLGVCRCYLIQADGTILVDCGVPKKENVFSKALEKLSVKPQDIQLIVITHGHWDHMGTAKAIKEMTGAQIAMHQHDQDRLEYALTQLPSGVTLWGKIMIKMMAMFVPFVRFPATGVDIVLGEEGLSLAEYGIPGRVICTPGHTLGSVSVLLDTGDALVGDLAMNGLPMRLGPGLPSLADDFGKVKESWRLLLDHGAKTVYPSHGKSFSADIIRRTVSLNGQ